MNMTTEIERIIDEILTPAEEETPVRVPKKRGRRKNPPIPVWALDFYNPTGNRTFALISMCIKEDLNQSIEQLALRLAAYKAVSPTLALKVLSSLSICGKLGYYDDKTLHFIPWYGTEAEDGLENLRD